MFEPCTMHQYCVIQTFPIIILLTSSSGVLSPPSSNSFRDRSWQIQKRCKRIESKFNFKTIITNASLHNKCTITQYMVDYKLQRTSFKYDFTTCCWLSILQEEYFYWIIIFRFSSMLMCANIFTYQG